jgi:hypothetical protein
VSTSPIISSPLYSNLAVMEQPVQSSFQQEPAQLSGTNAQDIEDIVQLSQFAQMAHQGGSPSVIASTIGLTVSEVDRDLGISTTSSSVIVAAPRGHGGENLAAPAAASDSKTATLAPTLSVRA